MEMVRQLKSALIALSLHLSTISNESSRAQRNSSMKARIATFLPGRTRSEQGISATPRGQGPPSRSSTESSAADNPRADSPTVVLYEALCEAFSDRPGLFPKDFGWFCECEKSGFPGCSNLEHFCQRVYIAILDYHQLEGSQRRGLAYTTDTCQMLLRIEKLDGKQRKKLNDDLRAAETLLKKLVNTNPP